MKLLAILLSCAFCFLSLTGCSADQDEDKLTIVCTVFPLYDWVMKLVNTNQNAEVILLADNGTDLHSYQPSAEDIVQMNTCDLLIMVGGTSDTWVTKALYMGEELPRVCRISDLEGITLREISAESLIADCEDEACEDTDHDHGHDHGAESVDEHLWLSLKNAAVACDAITRELCELDETNLELYQANLASYLASLETLDRSYTELVAEVENPTVLFADRFPFVYLMEDYGVRYAAAFRGCTTDTDADFETIRRLAAKVDEWHLSSMLVTESAVTGLADQIRANTRDKNQSILVMNSLQTVTKKELESGVSYLGIMTDNLDVLREALVAPNPIP